MSFDGEVDLSAWFLEVSDAYEARIALPRIGEHPGEMTFHDWSRDELKDNRIGIAEPAGDAQVLAIEALDLVLVPLVAFDDTGTRLGMGGGYYDRYFEASGRPPLIGIGYQCQQAPALPRSTWDITLDALVHDGGVLEFG